MVTALSKQAVQAIPATPPRYGLFIACGQASIEPAPGARVTDASAIEWSPEQAYGGGVVTIDCDGGTDEISPDTNIGRTTSEPFIVWAEDHCSTFGFRDHDFAARARRQLEAVQSAQAAEELWKGSLAAATPLANMYLAKDPQILTTAASAVLDAFVLLEMGLAEMLGGRRGMIHCTPGMLARLANAYLIERQGTVWVSPVGTVVVADAGYPGTGPAGDNGGKEWMYATPFIQYRLGEVMMVPGDWRETVDRATNDVQVVAQRTVLLQWDWNIPAGDEVGVLAVETSLTAFAGL